MTNTYSQYEDRVFWSQLAFIMQVFKKQPCAAILMWSGVLLCTTPVLSPNDSKNGNHPNLKSLNAIACALIVLFG